MAPINIKTTTTTIIENNPTEKLKSEGTELHVE